MEWYVVQVMTGKEQDYRQHARTLIDNSLGISLHVPIRRMPVRRRGKTLVEDKPVFPGYLFINTPALTPEQAHACRRVPGFVRWLGPGGLPELLHGQDLEILQNLLRHGEVLGISRAVFNQDMRIEVREGPLKGLEGRIIRVDKRKGRARVRLDMYHNSFEVDFAFELITESDKEPSRT